MLLIPAGKAGARCKAERPLRMQKIVEAAVAAEPVPTELRPGGGCSSRGSRWLIMALGSTMPMAAGALPASVHRPSIGVNKARKAGATVTEIRRPGRPRKGAQLRHRW